MEAGWRSNYLRYKSYFLNVAARYKERADLRVYLELILSLLAISFFSIFAIRPTLITISQLIKEIESKQETLQKIDSKIKQLSTAKSFYEAQKEGIDLITLAISNKPEPEKFARQIQNLSVKDQIKIMSLSTGGGVILGDKEAGSKSTQGQKPSETNSFDFTFHAKTSSDRYVFLEQFISDFLNLMTLSKIKSIKISTSKDELGKSLIMSISGEVPYIPKN